MTNNPTTTKNVEHRKKMEARKIFTGNFGGAPAKYKTDADLVLNIQEYFNSFYDDNNIVILKNKKLEEIGWDYIRVPSITGLALCLGFKSRKSLTDYNEKTEFSGTIKKAKLYIENFNEERLLQGKGYGPGIMFNLKNNFSWVDKQEIQNTNTNINLEVENSNEFNKLLKDNDLI